MNPIRALLAAPPMLFLSLLGAPPAEAASQAKPGQAGVRGGHPGGHWSGSHGRWGGRGAGIYRGGRHHHHHHGHHWRPWFGFYAAAPFVFGASYYYSTWDPYDGYWGPRYVYPRAYPLDEVEVVRRGEDLGPASEVDPRAPGAPQQAPLYMNYCASAKAYYPKVATCPEGWEFRRPNYRD